MSKANTVEDAAKARRYWLADNPGVLTRIAQHLGFTQPFVSDVLHGKRSSTDRAVEKALADRGAPGFEQYAASPNKG